MGKNTESLGERKKSDPTKVNISERSNRDLFKFIHLGSRENKAYLSDFHLHVRKKPSSDGVTSESSKDSHKG